MYIAAFVFGHDVDSYFLRTLENAEWKLTRQYMYLHSVLQVRRTLTLIDLEWKLKMKMATSKYEIWTTGTPNSHESGKYISLPSYCKKTHNLRFCECLLQKGFVWTPIFLQRLVGSSLWIIRRIPCGDITCSACSHTPLRVSSDPI